MTTNRALRVGYVLLAMGAAAAVGVAVMPTPASAATRPATPFGAVGKAARGIVSAPVIPRALVKPCEFEDASGAHDGPVCRWDAGTAGLANGGESFTAYRIGDGVLYRYDDGRQELTPHLIDD